MRGSGVLRFLGEVFLRNEFLSSHKGDNDYTFENDVSDYFCLVPFCGSLREAEHNVEGTDGYETFFRLV